MVVVHKSLGHQVASVSDRVRRLVRQVAPLVLRGNVLRGDGVGPGILGAGKAGIRAAHPEWQACRFDQQQYPAPTVESRPASG
jgi:hypothetical protein